MMVAVVALVGGVLFLLLPVALGLIAIASSNRDERKTVIAVVAIGGSLLLLCACAVAGILWFLSAPR